MCKEILSERRDDLMIACAFVRGSSAQLNRHIDSMAHIRRWIARNRRMCEVWIVCTPWSGYYIQEFVECIINILKDNHSLWISCCLSFFDVLFSQLVFLRSSNCFVLFSMLRYDQLRFISECELIMLFPLWCEEIHNSYIRYIGHCRSSISLYNFDHCFDINRSLLFSNTKSEKRNTYANLRAIFPITGVFRSLCTKAHCLAHSSIRERRRSSTKATRAHEFDTFYVYNCFAPHNHFDFNFRVELPFIFGSHKHNRL